MRLMLKNILVIMSIVSPVSSFALVFGGSNLGFSGYPAFDAYPPTPPYVSDHYAWQRYQQEVEDYADKARQYIEDANSDIQRIQEAQQDAINKTNDVVEEYNYQAR